MADLSVAVSGRVLLKQVGGNTRYARSVYGLLPSLGVDIQIRRPLLDGDGRARSLAYAGMEIFALPFVRHESVDLVHYPADTGPLFSASRVPLVTTVHGLATLHVADVRKSSSDKIWRARVAAAIRASARVITVSQSSADDILQTFPDATKKITVIPHGIDHDVFNPRVSSNDADLRTRAGIHGPYFVYVGNLDPRKNIVELCRAAESVFRTTHIPLVIAGAPAWGADPILEAIRVSPGVTYLGRVPEDLMLALVRGAVAFTFPSLYEGFGFPVLEAMACGTAVICSNRGSLTEIAGDAAALLTDVDANTIAATMIDVARDDVMRQELRELGLVRASQFTWDTSAAAHLGLFTEVAGR